MTNISDRLDRLRQGAENQRREIFDKLKQVAPDLLMAMQTDQKTFGRFAAVHLEMDGKVIYERGELMLRKNDKYMRKR